MAEDTVTFLDSAGNVISNDPVWLARRTLAEAGVEGKAPDFDMAGPYDHLDGPELRALTKERGIVTKGWRKASQFRDALEAWDEENPPKDTDDDDDESSGNGQSGDSDDDEE